MSNPFITSITLTAATFTAFIGTLLIRPASEKFFTDKSSGKITPENEMRINKIQGVAAICFAGLWGVSMAFVVRLNDSDLGLKIADRQLRIDYVLKTLGLIVDKPTS